MCAGLPWIETYSSTRNEEFKSINKKQTFKLGETSYETVFYKLVPIEIGGRKEYMEVGVIEADIPLLISRAQLEKWKVNLNFDDKTMTWQDTGDTVQLGMTSSGHLTLDLMDSMKNERNSMVKDVFLTNKDKDYYNGTKEIHTAFGHPSSTKLKETVRDSGITDEEAFKAIEDISQNCYICKRYRRRESRPKTCLPRARFFNEVLSLDLKPVATIIGDSKDKRQVVYMID